MFRNIERVVIIFYYWLVGKIFKSRATYHFVRCPICGKLTLDNFWVCENCYWEYDDLMVDEYSIVNQTNMNEFKMYYERFKDFR